MIIGLPKEIKEEEWRVALTPAGTKALVDRGHKVLVEKGAGIASGFSDDEYQKTGARLISDKKSLFDEADMIVKVKEPLPSEFDLFHEEQILFTYLHLAADKNLTLALLKKGIVGIAYETVEDHQERLSLLAPMSEIAGRSAVLIGAYFLAKHKGGSGVLIGGVPGVLPAQVLILGGGTVGANAAKMAAGLGARVIVMDIDPYRMRYLDDVLPPNVSTYYSSSYTIQKILPSVDLVIGAVLIPGAKTPHLVSRDMLSLMREGSVIVDVAVDQGGCIETTHPTTHDNPTFTVNGVIHYCVTNIPGVYARTSTLALTNATLPYIIKIADMGYRQAFAEDQGLAKGLNLAKGKITCKPVAEAHGMEWTRWEKVKYGNRGSRCPGSGKW